MTYWLFIARNGAVKWDCCNYENDQHVALYRLISYSKSALHVLGDVFAYRQEHLTVFTVSGSVHPKLLPAGENIAQNM
jgi:hypothetical protein